MDTTGFLDPDPDLDPYYLSKIQINLRKKFKIFEYVMNYKLLENIFYSMTTKMSRQDPDQDKDSAGSINKWSPKSGSVI